MRERRGEGTNNVGLDYCLVKSIFTILMLSSCQVSRLSALLQVPSSQILVSINCFVFINCYKMFLNYLVITALTVLYAVV